MYGQRKDRQNEEGNLIFFTERKNEKLDIVCHRDTKMLLINNCNQMKQQQITNRKKWMDKQEGGLFCLHSGCNDLFISTTMVGVEVVCNDYWSLTQQQQQRAALSRVQSQQLEIFLPFTSSSSMVVLALSTDSWQTVTNHRWRNCSTWRITARIVVSYSVHMTCQISRFL